MYIQLKQQAHDPTQENSKSTSKIQVYSDSKIPSRLTIHILIYANKCNMVVAGMETAKKNNFLVNKVN